MPFREVVGHRRMLNLLSASVAGGSLPPSLIFSGPEGVGKRLVARAVAQALNCTSPVSRGVRVQPDFNLDACGECPACRRIVRGTHPDVQVVLPGENGSIKIEQVREAVDRTMYRPFEGKRRVTVVDDADALVHAAQNALLKTLEEPSSSSVFILVTSRPDVLLPTVRSRCAQLRFSRLSPADVAAVLERDHQHARKDALALAAVADGSVRQALDVRAGGVADARRAVTELLHDARGKADARTRVERAKDLLKGGGPVAAEREYLELRLQAMAALVRDLGVLSARADDRLLSNVDLRSELEDLMKSYDHDRVLRLFAAVDRAHGALERNVSPKVVADWLAVQL